MVSIWIWKSVKTDVMDTIVEFHERGEFEKTMNASSIVIIP